MVKNVHIITFPGTNREKDMADAFTQITSHRPSFIWHKETQLPRHTDLIILPGGFSYGDYLRCGAMAAHSPIMQAVKEASQNGIPILGVCNGFQMLTETQLLPGALMRNRDLQFICKFVHLSSSIKNSALQSYHIPVAHGEGRYTADPATLDQLRANDQILYRYCDADGTINDHSNPNGSIHNIAGLIDRKQKIIGMMPHPENAIDSNLGSADGQALLEEILHELS